MRKKVVICSTFRTTQVTIMNDILKLLSGELSTKVIQRTEFIIKFNPYGGYYNLFIHAWSTKDAQMIRRIMVGYIKEKGENDYDQ